MGDYTQSSFTASESPLSESGRWVPIGGTTGVSSDSSGEVTSSTSGWQGTKLSSAEEAFTTVIYTECQIGTEAGSIGPAVWSNSATGWGGLGVTMTAADTLLIREYSDIEDIGFYVTKDEIYPSIPAGAVIGIEITDNVASDTSDFTIYLNDISVSTGTISKPDATTLQPGFVGQNASSGTLVSITARDTKNASNPSLDDVDTDEIVLDGQTAVALTYSNFTNPIDSAVLKSGSHESAMTNLSAGASSATADMPDVTQYTSVTAGCPYTTASNAVTVDIENSGDAETASLAVTRDPPSGWVAQELTSAVKTSGSVCKAFTGTIPDTSIIAYPTASTTAVSATGILTTNITSGSISMVYWDATAGTWQPFLVIMSGSEFSIQILGSAVIGTAIKATAIAGASL